MDLLMNNEGKILQLLNDFVAGEEFCNLSCDYCLTEGANLKEKHQFNRVDGKLNYSRDYKELVYSDGYKIKEQIDTALESYRQKFNAPILKLSGGEIMLIRNLVELIERESEHYECVQLLTNGLLLNEQIVSRLKHVKNLNIQLSMDGHTLEMNQCRLKSESLNTKLLHNLDILVNNNIVTEIYCVLSKVNIEKFDQFLEYIISNYGNKVHVIPFPVRFLGAREFFPGREQLTSLKSVIYNFDRYCKILPPFKYMNEMISFIENGIRQSRCLVPKVMSQVFDDGIITPCPNCWTVQIGNINTSMNTVTQNMQNHRIYDLMTTKKPRAPFCMQCFTDYHLFNLYFNNELTLEEISENRPILQGPKVQERLKILKSFITNEIKEETRL